MTTVDFSGDIPVPFPFAADTVMPHCKWINKLNADQAKLILNKWDLSAADTLELNRGLIRSELDLRADSLVENQFNPIHYPTQHR